MLSEVMMDESKWAITESLDLVLKKVKKEFEPLTSRKRADIHINLKSHALPFQDQLASDNVNAIPIILTQTTANEPQYYFGNHKETEVSDMLRSKELSSWMATIMTEVLEGMYYDVRDKTHLVKNHALLHSIWEKLHTGHWIDVPITLRTAFSWGSITIVGLLLKDLLETCNSSRDLLDVQSGAQKIVQACDRGLLMGRPLKENPLPNVASLLNGIAMGFFRDDSMLSISDILPNIPADLVPEEATFLSGISPIETLHLPSLLNFLLMYKNKLQPLKMSGIADSWPALQKWNFDFFRRVAGSRTVPVEVGMRYTDSSWSQTLMTIDHYLRNCINNNNLENKQKMYLAQHQLFDQIPELLSDIIIPDYCHMGENRPVVNAWVGPQGTVTPLHHDPDHNIFVQVYGYKVILLFPESDSKSLYAFENDLLNNTSQINLEDEVKKKNLFETWPLLRNANGYYLTLGPGEALYIPPKWWHYVRSLSNSISVSFWWS